MEGPMRQKGMVDLVTHPGIGNSKGILATFRAFKA